MKGWQTTCLSMRELPRDISGFELQAFFTFSPAERALIEARRGDSRKLGLALHIGFLRMTGRLLDAFRIVPPALWRHLGSELGIDAPELASLRALYGRGRTARRSALGHPGAPECLGDERARQRGVLAARPLRWPRPPGAR